MVQIDTVPMPKAFSNAPHGPSNTEEIKQVK
jgi:hypothetical protein